MSIIFEDRRSKSWIGRYTFLGVWIAVALIYLLCIPTLGALLYYNLGNILTSSLNIKIKFIIVMLAFLACIHGFLSLSYIFLKEFPRLIVLIENSGSALLITTMTGKRKVHMKEDVIAVTHDEMPNICWYQPYSLAIIGLKSVHSLKRKSGKKYLFPHESRIEDIIPKLD